MMLNTCALPSSMMLAISRVFSWVPVERKWTAASLLAGITARVLLSRRRATRSTMVLVTISPAGSLKLPPRPLVPCAIAGVHEARTRKIRYPILLTRNLFRSIVDPFRYTDSNNLNGPLERIILF